MQSFRLALPFVQVCAFLLLLSGSSRALPTHSSNHFKFLNPAKLLRRLPAVGGTRVELSQGKDSLLDNDVALSSTAAIPGVTAVLSEYGLQYAKDVVVTQILQELIPLAIPDLDLVLPTPVGHVAVNLSDTVLWNASVPTSKLYLDPISQSVTVYAGDIDANLTSAWSFALGPFLADQGNATITVSGLHVVAVGNLSEKDGGLVVHVEEVQCVIESLQILLHSPYSWIYNWLEARLPNHLRSAVESEIEWSMGMFVDELNDFLQALPRTLSVDCQTAVNVTVPANPTILPNAVVLSCEGNFQEADENCSRRHWSGDEEPVTTVPSSLGLRSEEGGGLVDPARVSSLWVQLPAESDKEVEWMERLRGEGGLWEREGSRVLRGRGNGGGKGVVVKPVGGRCETGNKMLDLTITEIVVNSALQVYYDTGALSFAVRSLPSSFPFQLNTKAWRFVLPSLYKQYPNKDLELAFEASSQPTIVLSSTQGIIAAAKAAFFLRVLLEEGPKDVLCVDIGLEMSAVASLRGNNLTAVAHLATLSVDIRWSTVGSLSQPLLEGITLALTKVVLFPLLNYRLGAGFPLPSIPGVLFINATVAYEDGALQVCTDLEYTGGIFGYSLDESRQAVSVFQEGFPQEQAMGIE